MTAKETQIALIKAIKIYAICKRKDAEWRYSDLLNRLMEHESQLCREQREICTQNMSQEVIYCGESAIIKRIINAQMPEL